MLNASTSSKVLEIEGYTLARNDRDAASGERGGAGIIVYTRNIHCFDDLGSWHLCTPDVEWVWSKSTFPPNMSDVCVYSV